MQGSLLPDMRTFDLGAHQPSRGPNPRAWAAALLLVLAAAVWLLAPDGAGGGDGGGGEEAFRKQRKEPFPCPRGDAWWARLQKNLSAEVAAAEAGQVRGGAGPEGRSAEKALGRREKRQRCSVSAPHGAAARLAGTPA